MPQCCSTFASMQAPLARPILFPTAMRKLQSCYSISASTAYDAYDDANMGRFFCCSSHIAFLASVRVMQLLFLMPLVVVQAKRTWENSSSMTHFVRLQSLFPIFSHGLYCFGARSLGVMMYHGHVQTCIRWTRVNHATLSSLLGKHTYQTHTQSCGMRCRNRAKMSKGKPKAEKWLRRGVNKKRREDHWRDQLSAAVAAATGATANKLLQERVRRL
ncbi:hypothetical protein BC826DRAFT_308690 [Russula brevipes]|nr:hypothetical protein BC826DRAFT_308690 [Russula brevipes]